MNIYHCTWSQFSWFDAFLYLKMILLENAYQNAHFINVQCMAEIIRVWPNNKRHRGQGENPCFLHINVENWGSSPVCPMSSTFTGSWGLQTSLHTHKRALIASIQISITELIYIAQRISLLLCSCFFFNMSAVTEIVTPAFLKITKISNSLHSCWKDFSLPAMKKKWVRA